MGTEVGPGRGIYTGEGEMVTHVAFGGRSISLETALQVQEKGVSTHAP